MPMFGQLFFLYTTAERALVWHHATSWTGRYFYKSDIPCSDVYGRAM